MHMLYWAVDGFPYYRPSTRGEADNATAPLRKTRTAYSLDQGIRSKEPGGKFDGTLTAD